jgi:hypothetical protein
MYGSDIHAREGSLPLAEVNRGLEILRDKVDDPVRVIIEPAA